MGMRLKNISEERGMAAIAVTVVLMFVISIIVLGFAQTVRREQRNALDNQLSTQAYYAAEAGINMVQDKAKTITGAYVKHTCGPNAEFPDYSIGENAEVTCLLVTNEVTTLEYQAVGMNSVPMHIKVKTGQVGTLHVSWQSPANPTSTSGCPSSVPANAFPASWSCRQPVLRLDLVPIAGSMSADSVKAGQFTVFLYPTTSGTSSVGYVAGNAANGAKATLARVQCAVPTALKPKLCTGVITGLTSQAYAARMMSIYGTADVTILAPDGSNTKPLIEGQLEVDSTAKAADVLKRVKARLPISTSIVPDFALSAGAGICKRYEVAGETVNIADQPNHPACAIP